MLPPHARIALVGDLHAYWDDRDSSYFSRSDYDSILITGDLGSSSGKNGVGIARSLARIEKDTLVMLGNNDAHEYARIVAELNYQAGRALLLGGLSGAPVATSEAQRVRACGFSNHAMRLGDLDFTLVAARPFAMGGGEFSFGAAIMERFQIANLEESTQRLCALVDASETEHVVFLAHNGPLGLGEESDAPFGRDFHPDAGDWGDRDLAQAIAHARQSSRKVLAVLAGHMHWRLRGGGKRHWCVEEQGTLYVNAASVPRHIRSHGILRRHHLALALTHEAASVEEVWVVD